LGVIGFYEVDQAKETTAQINDSFRTTSKKAKPYESILIAIDSANQLEV
jgi:hypothetical protein